MLHFTRERGSDPFAIYNLGALFGGGGGGGGQQYTPQIVPATPSAVPAPPTFDQNTVQALADAQRKKFMAGGGRSTTMLTGGLGIPSGGNASTPVLGGVGGGV